MIKCYQNKGCVNVKSILRYFAQIFCLGFMLPAMVDAATFSLKEKESKDLVNEMYNGVINNTQEDVIKETNEDN